MSSFDCTVSAQFPVKPSIHMAAILLAIQSFLERYDIDLEIVSGTEASDDSQENTVFIENGNLSLSLNCWCAGQDFVPEGIDDGLTDALQTLALSHGALEIFNQDTPANAESTLMIRFFGQDDNDRDLARVEYGIEKFRGYVEPVLGADVFKEITSLALARLSSAQAQKSIK